MRGNFKNKDMQTKTLKKKIVKSVKKTKTQAQKNISSAEKQVKKTVGKGVSLAKKELKKADALIRKNPEKAVAVSAGVGALVGGAIAGLFMKGKKKAKKK